MFSSLFRAAVFGKSGICRQTMKSQWKLLQNHQKSQILKQRNFSSQEPLTLGLIEQRVILVLRLYDKINPDTFTVNSHFMKGKLLGKYLFLNIIPKFLIQMPVFAPWIWWK
jgi:hypothetical protein